MEALNNWKDFMNRHRIVMFAEVSVKESGEKVYHEGDIVAEYIDDGYNVISCAYSPFKGVLPRKVLIRLCCSLAALNPDKEFNVLLEFIRLYVNHLSNNPEGLEYSKDVLSDVLNYAIDNYDEETLYSTRKFRWVGKYMTANVSLKRKIVMEYMNDRKSANTFKMIDNAIEWLMIESTSFITAQSIVDSLDDKVSINTVRRYLPEFRNRVNSHNRAMFNTDDFNMYRRFLSIHSINNAIKVLSSVEEAISKKNVSRRSNLHYNTVRNLWEEDEVQEQLDKYNQIAS